jgi:hypothetical protein
LEWAIAFIFTFYVFSFFIDLIPAVGTRGVRGGAGHSKGPMAGGSGDTEMEREIGMGRNTADSERTLGRNDLEIPGGKREVAMANNF